ncbi:MAG: HAD family hydrolase [Nitrososphaerales archaeon]
MNIKAVIFDLDGTVVRFALDFIRARKEAIAEMGRRDIGVNDLSESLSLYSMLKIVKDRLDVEAFSDLEKFLWEILEKMELRAAEETDLQPDALQTLLSIKNLGLRMAIVTNNGRKATSMVIKKFGLNDFFDFVVTREDAKELKPDGGSIKRALEILGIDSSEAVYVGDGVIDILAAEKANVISVAIPTGVSRINDLVKAKPDYVIGSLKDITKLIESIGQ